MTQVRTNRSPIIFTALGIAVVLPGCSDPRFEQKQEVRNARITRQWNSYATHDAAGVDRMRQTLEFNRKHNERQSEYLSRTCGLIRSLHERDLRRWKEEEPIRRARIEALLRSKPGEIADTYAKMAY